MGQFLEIAMGEAVRVNGAPEASAIFVVLLRTYFLKFLSRVEFFFENAKMHIAPLKKSEVGLLRIHGGFRVSS